MSGDVQPRKRKDRKKKKDDLGIEEPRGTAAALGEGDVFIHSHLDHSTGGHWCAKIIFFSLLAVLVTLIGLIILENRGLTELEANTVESQYSGILEGWLEDTPDEDHHDEHTLDLKHHDEEEMEDNLLDESDQDDEDEHDHDDEDEHDLDEEDDEHDDGDDVDDDDEHEESAEINEDDEDVEEHDEENEQEESAETNEDDQDLEEHDADNEDDEEVNVYNQYSYNEPDDDDDDGHNEDDYENKEIEEISAENFDDDKYDKIDYKSKEVQVSQEDNEYSEEREDEEDTEDNDMDDEQDDDEEIEKIEKEVTDDDVSKEVTQKVSAYERRNEIEASKENASPEENDVEEDFLDADEDYEPPIERIVTPPAGKPFVEIEEEKLEKPADTLADEEEYEKQQEELRKEEAEASHMWLKLAVGGALLVATHAVLRRATAPRDEPENEEPIREVTPLTERRMTLIPEETTTPKMSETEKTYVSPTTRQGAHEEVFKKPAPVVHSAPFVRKDSGEEEKITKTVIKAVETSKAIDKELYSDDEEIEEEEEEEDDDEVEEEKVIPQKAPVAPQKVAPQKTAPQPTAATEHKAAEDSEPEEVPDDVEIIDEEQIEEELEEEEEEDEEEISDVDDTELLTRLEAKYGRLPEPERPGMKHKDGGNSIEDMWPGEPSDSYWRQQLDQAEDELNQGSWESCEKLVSAAALGSSGRARWLLARALDLAAETKRDNRILTRAINAYLNLLKMNEGISDKKLLEVAQRTIDRIQFRGTYLSAEPVYRLLIRRFPHDVNYRNNLTVSFLMANRADLADSNLKETLSLWPNDRIALAHYGFVLKTHHNKLEEAVQALRKALDGDSGPANEPRFYYHLGDALLLLGRPTEAHEVHVRGAALGHFLSPAQRSLYNVPRLKSHPWWKIEETPYVKLARALESSWREILKEGEAAKAIYEKEKEGLRERGEWSQLDLIVRGREIPGRCERAPVTCALVRSEAAAAGCRRGQVKFSSMAAGTHVRAHVGPTNCRLRMHLGLSNTKDTFIRVDKETRQWQVGKTLLFDDSFEHEVWHNGTGDRLVLIVDVWHPDLTPRERRALPAI